MVTNGKYFRAVATPNREKPKEKVKQKNFIAFCTMKCWLPKVYQKNLKRFLI